MNVGHLVVDQRDDLLALPLLSLDERRMLSGTNPNHALKPNSQTPR